MGTISGPEVPACGTGPIHARHTAGRTPTSNVSVPVIQPLGTDQQLGDAVNSNVTVTAADGQAARDVEAPDHRNGQPATDTESSVREGTQPGLVQGRIKTEGP